MTVCLVGHPFAPIGMGEHMRGVFRALRSVGVTPKVLDVYKLNPPDADALREIVPFCTNELAETNIFNINGDEVDQVLAHLRGVNRPAASRNIVYPAWELARYPEVWVKQLERFDEIWAPSRFVADSIRPWTSMPVTHVPLACEVLLDRFLGRRYFGLPEAPFLFLFSYDIRSFNTRKNPDGVIEAFRRFVRRAPHANAMLVMKVNGAHLSPEQFEGLKTAAEDLHGRIAFIERGLTNNEVKNLIRCCDCYVSLHRSEGFGFGMAEAMALGKAVIATPYSGNMDYMADGTFVPVRYELVPVPEGAYPHGAGQHWAEADLEDASRQMGRLVDDPQFAARVGRRASSHFRSHFGYRAGGLRYLDLIERAAAGVEGSTGRTA